jgi:uncharacterized coiled-coil protein SlyX
LYTLEQEKTITIQASVIGGQGATMEELKGSLEALTERLAALEQASARR